MHAVAAKVPVNETFARANGKRVKHCRQGSDTSSEDQIPEERNPMSVTHLKMVGRDGEEEVAMRLKKPGSGTVVDEVGIVGKSLQDR